MEKEKREAYTKKYEAQIGQLEADLKKLKAKAAQASAEARIGYEKQIEDLQRRTAEQRQKLDDLRKAGEDVWDGLSNGFESAWDELQSAWANAKTKFS